jgi:hypothetical protein
MSHELKITDAEGTRVFSIPERDINCIHVWKEMYEMGKINLNDDPVPLAFG